jgi:hypothetical protein
VYFNRFARMSHIVNIMDYPDNGYWDKGLKKKSPVIIKKYNQCIVPDLFQGSVVVTGEYKDLVVDWCKCS